MPSLEAKRLEALYALEILDTPREERFDRITRTAVRLFRMPKSLLAFVDETRAWVKSDVGTSIDRSAVPSPNSSGVGSRSTSKVMHCSRC